MKASPESETRSAGPSMACHRSSNTPETEAKRGNKSPCSNVHAKPAWNPEPPCLPQFTLHSFRFGADLWEGSTLHLGIENAGDKYYYEHLNSLNPFTASEFPRSAGP